MHWKQMSPNRGVSSGTVSFMLMRLRVQQSNKPGLAAEPSVKGCRAAGEKPGGNSKSSQASRGEKKGGQIALADNGKMVHANKQNDCVLP